MFGGRLAAVHNLGAKPDNYKVNLIVSIVAVVVAVYHVSILTILEKANGN